MVHTLSPIMHIRIPQTDRLNQVWSLVIWCQFKPMALGSNNSASNNNRPRAISGGYGPVIPKPCFIVQVISSCSSCSSFFPSRSLLGFWRSKRSHLGPLSQQFSVTFPFSPFHSRFLDIMATKSQNQVLDSLKRCAVLVGNFALIIASMLTFTQFIKIWRLLRLQNHMQ